MAWVERYVTTTGAGLHDGSSEANAWTLAEAIAAVATGNRVNVKAGTYANTTTSLTFATAGTTTAPIWWRGYSSTIGDLDSDFVTAKPAITFTTGTITVSGAHQIFSNFDISGASTSAVVTVSGGAGAHWQRARIENSGTGANSRAISVTSGGSVWVSCYLRASAQANMVVNVTAAIAMFGCTITSNNAAGTAGDGISLGAGATAFISFCTFESLKSNGITTAATSPVNVMSCTFSGCGSDGINYTALPTTFGVVVNSLFRSNGGYGIHNSTGTDTNLIHRSNNDFYNNTSGTESGFGDSPSFREQTESSDPVTSATDLSLVTGANARANGMPGLFENRSYTSYMDIGAVQVATGASGGGPLIGPGRLIRS